MAKKFKITGTRSAQTIEAEWYQQEGEFFVFYNSGSADRHFVVATVAAPGVHIIRTESDETAK